MIRDASESGNDGMLIENYGMDDIDIDTLHSYRQIFEIRNHDHVFNGYNDKEFLRNLGGYTTERASGKEGLTVAGLLMFGKGLPVRDRFDNFRMDYLDQSNLLPGMRWSDRLTYDGNWANNLFNFFRLVLPKLSVGTKHPFKLDGIQRIDETLVDVAIREAFTNQIVHADYLITGVLKVVKKDNYLLFSNPGSLRIPVERIYKGDYSTSRNPRIQNMFRMIGFGENIGSGFPTILRAWKEEKWREPDLREVSDVNTVELKLWTTSLLPQRISEQLHELFGSSINHLMADEQRILAVVASEDNVTNARLQTILDKNSIEVGWFLSHLTSQGMLCSDHRGRWTTYRLNSSFTTTQMDGGENGGENGGGNGGGKIHLSRVQNQIIRILSVKPNATYKELGDKIAVGTTTIYRNIQFLKDNNIIVRNGSVKGGVWSIVNRKALDSKDREK